MQSETSYLRKMRDIPPQDFSKTFEQLHREMEKTQQHQNHKYLQDLQHHTEIFQKVYKDKVLREEYDTKLAKLLQEEAKREGKGLLEQFVDVRKNLKEQSLLIPLEKLDPLIGAQSQKILFLEEKNKSLEQEVTKQRQIAQLLLKDNQNLRAFAEEKNNELTRIAEVIGESDSEQLQLVQEQVKVL